ncbi:MAG TPA: NAD-dependent epimerase/dehydratase family protein [Methanoregula sp.]|nr:NAD-dependent epimerase/dehydratase family protein [Methanoregula sp.]
MKVLVTGAAGFTGRCMMHYLVHREGLELTGMVHDLPLGASTAKIAQKSCILADLLDRDHLFAKVAGVCPDAIVHLAGRTHGTLDELLEANVAGTKNILDAGYTANPDCRMVVISSSAVYGYKGTRAIRESARLQPLSEYGISKMAQDEYALMYYRLHDANVCVARPFNLVGAGQPETFVCANIVKQVAEIEEKEKQALDLLETTSSRDFIDVRDAVRGYWELASCPEFSRDCAGKAFNLGSGTASSIAKIVSLVEEITGRHYEMNLPATPPRITLFSQQSDNTRITRLTGWIPEIPLRDTLLHMLDSVRKER